MTIRDIAEKSGYSVSTVSRVLNNRRDASPGAKEKIDEIVAQFHFVPNNNAKHLKQSFSRTIAVLVKGTSNMLFFDILEEIQRRAEHTKYALSIIYLDEEDNEVEQALTVCREKKPVGMLFLGGNPEFFQSSFSEISIPCVLVSNQGGCLAMEHLSSVATDDVGAAKCAIDYLIAQGHRKIGILGGDPAVSHTSRQRFLGCQKSFEAHGILFDHGSYYEKARFSLESGYQAVQRLWKNTGDLTAVFAMSDVMAIGAIRGLLDEGIRVPEDISVMGFDGIALADYYHPKLATIRQKYKVLAEQSLAILLQMMECGSAPVHKIVPFQLIQGESVVQLS